MEPEQLRRIAVKAASETAGLLRDHACQPEMSVRVSGETTRADKMAEEYIVDVLKSEGVRAVIIGEEGGVYGSGDIVALIDPLDGSVNYLSCIPWASVSIAFTRLGASSFREVIAGAIAPIFYGDTISFAGGRCFIGGIPAEAVEPYKRIMAVYVEHPDAVRGLEEVIRRLGGFKVRSLGSAALEIAYTALGLFTLFVDVRSKLRNVDIAAAGGMLVNCGGALIGPKGVEPPLDTGSVSRVGSIIAARDRVLAGEVYSVIGPQMRRPGS